MGDISQIEAAEGVVKKPNTNGAGHWSAFEVGEWRKKIGEAFDQLAHLDDVKRFEKEHDIEQRPKPNGFDRLTRLGDDLEKAVRVKEEEAEFGQEPTGFGPSVDPLLKNKSSET
jgi:hypothetical protein